jgi:agmatinase
MNLTKNQGLILNSSIHAAVRAPLVRPKGDLRNDRRCGFEIIKAREIDTLGIQGVIDALKARVGDTKVYISVDIDSLDPVFAPGMSISITPQSDFYNGSNMLVTATGTSEPGGWSTREMLTIIDGLKGLQVVGADVVEVAPVYDNPGETTVLAAAEIVHSLLTLMVQVPVQI